MWLKGKKDINIGDAMPRAWHVTLMAMLTSA